MAKDGTNRGGSRIGAGRKPKSLHDQIQAGQDAQVIDLPTPTNLEGHVMPPVKKYLKAKQKNGLEFDAADIFKETWE